MGWRVRYEIVGGAPAQLDETGAQVLEVRTDSQGRATVTIVPVSTDAGTTQLSVQVIRGGESIGGMDRIIVGEGSTSVNWAGEQFAATRTEFYTFSNS